MPISHESSLLLARLPVESPELLREFCKRWKISRLEGFGSWLRADFGPASDVDLLYSFQPDAHWTMFDVMEMEEELERLLCRDVDFVSRRAIEQTKNHFIREQILGHTVELYAA